MKEIVTKIAAANPTRSHHELARRMEKLVEEAGEVAEARLNLTSPHNGKAKTLADLREELVDCIIVAVDIALTPLPVGPTVTVAALAARMQTAYREPAQPIQRAMMRMLGRLALAYDALETAGHDALEPTLDWMVLAANTIDVACLAARAAHDVPWDILVSEIDRKLGKWAANRASQIDVVNIDDAV